jgi:hypothetical protein
MAAQPVAQQQVAIDLRAAGRVDVQVHVGVGALEAAALVPVWLADDQHGPGRLQVRAPGRLVRRVGHDEQDVDDRLGGQPPAPRSTRCARAAPPAPPAPPGSGPPRAGTGAATPGRSRPPPPSRSAWEAPAPTPPAGPLRSWAHDGLDGVGHAAPPAGGRPPSMAHRWVPAADGSASGCWVDARHDPAPSLLPTPGAHRAIRRDGRPGQDQLQPLVVPHDSQTKHEPAGRIRTPQVEQ